MTFSRPSCLLLLAVPLALMAFETWRRGPRLVFPFDHAPSGGSRLFPKLLVAAAWFPPLLLGVAILILAGPLQTARPRQARKLTNIELLLDVSGSMQSPLGEGTRYDAAMRAIGLFADRRQGDAFGLTIFGSDVLRWTPLTKDLAALRSATPFVRPEKLPPHFGGTEIARSVRFSRETLLARGTGGRMMILVSDGQSSDLDIRSARQIGAQLAEDGIRLHLVHIGDEPVPQETVALSRTSGGSVFRAENETAVEAVFTQIDQMEPVELLPEAAAKIDRFGPFAWAGLVLLVPHVLSLLGLRYTPW